MASRFREPTAAPTYGSIGSQKLKLAHSAGRSDSSIADELSVNRKTVILWRNRFAEQRLDGLWEIAPGRGRKPIHGREKIAVVVKVLTVV